MVDGTCPQLRRLHLTSNMVKDHLTESYFTALGRPNPLHDWLKRQEQEQDQGKTTSEDKEQHVRAVAEDDKGDSEEENDTEEEAGGAEEPQSADGDEEARGDEMV